MRIKTEHAIASLQAQGRWVPDRTRIEQALAQIDQGTIEAEEDARWKWVKWDRKTPIRTRAVPSGVPAEHFLKRQDTPSEGDIYLLQDAATGLTVVFQPHQPWVGGLRPMRPEHAHMWAELHRWNLVEERAEARVIQRVMEILQKGDAPPGAAPAAGQTMN